MFPLVTNLHFLQLINYVRAGNHQQVTEYCMSFWQQEGDDEDEGAGL